MPVVRRLAPFEADLALLRLRYAEIDAVVDDFCSTLALGLLEAKPAVVPGSNPPALVHRVDYPPFGAGGKGRFAVTMIDRGSDVLLVQIRVSIEHAD
jgi:hypothetical protein